MTAQETRPGLLAITFHDNFVETRALRREVWARAAELSVDGDRARSDCQRHRSTN